MSNPIRLVVKHQYDTSPERVFDAWLDPAQAGQFLFKTPTGQMQRVEIDGRVGGRFVIIERRDGQDAEHLGEYLEIDRPHHLRFSFGFGSEASNPVSIEIQPQGSGCELTLTHEMPAEWSEYRERTEQGWRGILEGLAALLA